MKAAISQPTYLPWVGYFDLIDQVDAFVFLDSVQFEKRSWQQRNRIKTSSGLQWLTVPIAVRGKQEQRIDEAEIQGPTVLENHLRTIELHYRKAQHFETYYPGLADVFHGSQASSLLVDLNLRLIRWITQALGLQTTLYRSSEMLVSGKRTELLASIAHSIGATEYISALGSADYLLNELNVMTDRGIGVKFQHYEHPEYTQLFPPFLPYATVLDLLFNEGPHSLEVLRSGRRAPSSPEEVKQLLAKQVQV